MQWVEKEAGKWAHPSYGAIEHLEDGRWRIINPASEIVDPVDGDTGTLADSQSYQAFIWAGWIPCGEGMWHHTRYGTICKTAHGEWFGRMGGPAAISDKDDPYRVGAGWKGPYERSGWAKKELWRLWPLTHAAKIVSRAETGTLHLFAVIAALAITDPYAIAIVTFAAFLFSLVTDNRTAWASMHRDLRLKCNLSALLVSSIPLYWLFAFCTVDKFPHPFDRSFLVPPLVGAGVLYLVMRVIGMLTHALCIAAGPVSVVAPEKRMPVRAAAVVPANAKPAGTTGE
jgi:hypothetical protein